MKKLYDVTITFDPKDYDGKVEGVALCGDFLFYESGLTGNTDKTGMVDCDRKFPPAQYHEGLCNIGGRYCHPMEKNADGVYTATLKLPAGLYPYHFLINPDLCPAYTDPKMAWGNLTMPDGSQKGMADFESAMKSGFSGERNHMITDPKNPPVVTTVTGRQQNSELCVGTPDECPWLPIADRSKAGTITYMSYADIDGKPQSIAVYLPAGFDREKTYPLIMVSHGGGGNEADWPSQGGICNIMDNLIAAGKTREAILVCMNNSVYQWDFAKIADNCEKCVIPFVEKIFGISGDTADRAFCGLSMGSMTTLYMYMHRSHVYDYFGAFSGGVAPGNKYFDIDDPHLKDVTLMIGSAEEDIAYNERDIGVPPTIRALEAKGLPYIPYFTTGSHDWFCWEMMFEHFAKDILWKKA